MIEELPKEQQCVVDFEALYRTFGLETTREFDAFLDEEREKAAQFVSGHDYDPEGQGVERARLFEELGDLYPRFGWEP